MEMFCGQLDDDRLSALLLCTTYVQMAMPVTPGIRLLVEWFAEKQFL